MNTTHNHTLVTPNTSADNAPNRPAVLPRRQRIASALASAVISVVLLGGIAWGMIDTGNPSVLIAGEPAAPALSAA